MNVVLLNWLCDLLDWHERSQISQGTLAITGLQPGLFSGAEMPRPH